jgi:hypothetical protein
VKTITDSATRLLIKFLARTESPWRPIRAAYQERKAGGNVYAARQRGLQGDGGDQRTRKREQLGRDELTKAGYLRDGSLTPDGKRFARGLVWPYTAAELYEAMERIAERIAAGDCRPGGWVPETLIAGATTDQWPDPFADLQALLIVALTDGVVESTSTFDGSAFYRLLAPWPDGREQLALPEDFAGQDSFTELYYDEYAATWQRILNDKRRYQDIGPIPIPESGELQSGRDPEDLTGIKPLFPQPKSTRKAR